MSEGCIIVELKEETLNTDDSNSGLLGGNSDPYSSRDSSWPVCEDRAASEPVQANYSFGDESTNDFQFDMSLSEQTTEECFPVDSEQLTSNSSSRCRNTESVKTNVDKSEYDNEKPPQLCQSQNYITHQLFQVSFDKHTVGSPNWIFSYPADLDAHSSSATFRMNFTFCLSKSTSF